jgi:hypothetical protein
MKSLIPANVVNMKEYLRLYLFASIPAVVLALIVEKYTSSERLSDGVRIVAIVTAMVSVLILSYKRKNPHATLTEILELISVGYIYKAEDEREESVKQGAGHKTFLLMLMGLMVFNTLRMVVLAASYPNVDPNLSFEANLGGLIRHIVDLWVIAGFITNVACIGAFRFFLRQERVAFSK